MHTYIHTRSRSSYAYSRHDPPAPRVTGLSNFLQPDASHCTGSCYETGSHRYIIDSSRQRPRSRDCPRQPDQSSGKEDGDAAATMGEPIASLAATGSSTQPFRTRCLDAGSTNSSGTTIENPPNRTSSPGSARVPALHPTLPTLPPPALSPPLSRSPRPLALSLLPSPPAAPSSRCVTSREWSRGSIPSATPPPTRRQPSCNPLLAGRKTFGQPIHAAMRSMTHRGTRDRASSTTTNRLTFFLYATPTSTRLTAPRSRYHCEPILSLSFPSVSLNFTLAPLASA